MGGGVTAGVGATGEGKGGGARMCTTVTRVCIRVQIRAKIRARFRAKSESKSESKFESKWEGGCGRMGACKRLMIGGQIRVAHPRG